MRKAFVILMASAVATVSCHPAERAQPAPTGTSESGLPPAEEMPAAQRVASLAGEWRLAGIDGAEFNEPYGLALSGDAERLWWEPICARQGRRYRISGSAIAFSALDPPPRSGTTTAPVCVIAPPARVADVMRALDAAQTVERTPQNGILIAGGGHSLLLFSQ